MTLDAGTRLGHYEVVSPLGSGGMGEVYRARDTRLGRDVAIKLLPVHLQQDSEALARFQREAKIISGLSHPHILTIHEVGKARLPGQRRATHYMVTEFIDGKTLREVMAVDSDGRKMLDYLAQVADALQKAHSAGIVHRDLKPENVMVTADGYAKVLDFGLAKMVSRLVDETKEDSETARFQTQQGIVIGTIGYMSPEQVQGKPLDHRSDIFSFGCIVYEVLTGHRPFEAQGIVDTLHLIIHATPAALPSSVGPELKRIVNRCLAKEPLARFPAMRDLAGALRDAAFDWDGRVRASSRKVRMVTTSPVTSRTKAIAVMPFANLSNDPEMEYLSDGLTESIIHALSRVGKRLKVMARSTVFAYKSTEFTPQQLGAELSVTAIVTGRVHRLGNTLTVGVELVSTSDGSQIWGDRFRKPFADIFEVHDAIATHISEQLKLKLTTGEKRRLAHRPTRKSDAFELYLKGRFYANKRTTEGVRRAIQNFERAIEIDPDYALAHSGLADCYTILLGRFLAPPEECSARIEDASRRAILLDPMLAEPHTTLGGLESFYKWNWLEADREFRQAIYHDPSYATAHHWFSIFLTWMERFDDGLREAKVAAELEPLSLLLNANYSDVLYFAGRYDDALNHCKKVLELEPRYFLGNLLLSRILATLGAYEYALEAVKTAIAAEGRYPELLASQGYIFGRMGEVDAARAILAELEEMGRTKFVAPVFLAEVHLGLGDFDAALTHTEAFFRVRGEIGEILVGPRFAPLRQDPRFAEMLQRVEFPERLTLPESIQFEPTVQI